jgi:Histidine kinase-, DNA gyrase B-, and HSP90-like ATPase
MNNSTVQGGRISEMDNEINLVESIRRSKSSDQVVETTLKTDQRVIARVTDGIYRQPGSALRELISNAYDADATRVVIKTDAPRFDRISVEDDGHGMSPEALAHLLLHIGGSAKRSEIGPDLGVTSSKDPLSSPMGRRLIGKIGIGLFSVSQLTYSFQIVTKVKGDSFRTIATVALRQYNDEEVAEAGEEDGQFESGKVNIWREKARDSESHGTTIVLTSIRPQARDTLRSREIWSVIDSETFSEFEGRSPIEPPRFHIGRVDSSDNTDQTLRKTLDKFDSLPWDENDEPAEAFRKLVQCVWDREDQSNPNTQLDRIFDYYLRMVWQLSLAVPLPYVEGHLFDMDEEGWEEVFRLSNQPKGAAERIELAKQVPVRKKLGLVDPIRQPGPFEIFLDDLQLFRPIKFKGLPTTSHALKKPLVFLGKCREEFKKLPRELSGGPLDFEAYLFWTPKVVPTEHQGSLIRIHGSSGTLFDPTFMRYQVSELTRLRQITCEIFVKEGLDSALNIDRESFNNAHPHSIYITRWLHNALRQLATAQKRLAGEVRERTRSESKGQRLSQIQLVAREAWKDETDDGAAQPPSVEFSDAGPTRASVADAYIFSRSAVIPAKEGRKTTSGETRDTILEEKLKSITQVLASFGLLEILPRRKQENLLRAIYAILAASES